MRKILLCLFAGLTVVLIGVSYVFFSIALRRTNELKKARMIAEEANESKTQFLANMSHEIRTPMTAILGFADEIRESGDLSRAPGERIEAIDTIRRNGEHLLNLINDILDLTKIESGKMELERVRFSAVEMLADIQSLMQMQASEKGLSFNIEFVGGIPASIESDPMRVRQVLVNLIGNAIKFTLAGGVGMVVSMVDDGIGNPVMRIDVVDSGIGLSEEQVGKLFKAYSQADASMSRRFGGTGLGLNICHRLVEMLDGSIEIESKQDKGSTFSLMIPVGSLAGIETLDDPGSTLNIRNQRAAMSLPEPSKLDARILLAEDGADNQKLIAHMLRKTGAQVQIVENGQLALDAAILAKEEGDAFDVILMDMQMPVMDGYQATDRLRRAGYTGTIIALTAHAMDDERRKCLKVGCDEFVSKPIDRNRLIRLIDEYSKGSRASSAA